MRRRRLTGRSLRGTGTEVIEKLERMKASGMDDVAISVTDARSTSRGLTYAGPLFRGELSDAFWGVSLPQSMNTPAASSL